MSRVRRGIPGGRERGLHPERRERDRDQGDDCANQVRHGTSRHPVAELPPHGLLDRLRRTVPTTHATLVDAVTQQAEQRRKQRHRGSHRSEHHHGRGHSDRGEDADAGDCQRRRGDDDGATGEHDC